MENKNCSWEYIHCTVSTLLKLSEKELSVVPSETIIDLFYAAEEYSIMKTQELADTLGFDKLNTIKLVCFRKASRLGDCDKAGNIRIDFKSLFGYDYDGFISILIHELCHTVQLNHTKEFWTIFEQSAKRVGLLPSEYDGWQETKLEQDPFMYRGPWKFYNHAQKYKIIKDKICSPVSCYGVYLVQKRPQRREY